MAIDDTFRPDLKDKSRTAFDRVTQSERFQNPVNIDRAIKAAKIDFKADRLTERAQDHHTNMREQFVEQEFNKLQKEQKQRGYSSLRDGPKPSSSMWGAKDERHALLKTAERNVHLRHLTRLNTIQRISKRMTRQIERDRPRTR